MFYNTGIGTYVWIVTNREELHRKGKIQLVDARERWQPMRRSLGDKRRYMGDEDIDETVREYGGFAETETSRIFDNADFGYQRVPIERPLRLLYEMDTDRKARFLDAVPHLLDDVQSIDRELGREPHPDWSAFEKRITELLKGRDSRWKKSEHKLFREVFTETNPDAEPVVFRTRRATGDPEARVWGWFPAPGKNIERMYEADTKLRDFENVPLKDEVPSYFHREVEPHVPDAWADGENIRTAYEINFNRHFYRYTPPRPLEEIDADIKRMEEEIIRLLREVTA